MQPKFHLSSSLSFIQFLLSTFYFFFVILCFFVIHSFSCRLHFFSSSHVTSNRECQLDIFLVSFVLFLSLVNKYTVLFLVFNPFVISIFPTLAMVVLSFSFQALFSLCSFFHICRFQLLLCLGFVEFSVLLMKAKRNEERRFLFGVLVLL